MSKYQAAIETIIDIERFLERLSDTSRPGEVIIAACSVSYVWENIVSIMKSDYIFPDTVVTGKHGGEYAVINGHKVRIVGINSEGYHKEGGGEQLRGSMVRLTLVDFTGSHSNPGFKYQLVNLTSEFIETQMRSSGTPSRYTALRVEKSYEEAAEALLALRNFYERKEVKVQITELIEQAKKAIAEAERLGLHRIFNLSDERKVNGEWVDHEFIAKPKLAENFIIQGISTKSLTEVYRAKNKGL